MLKNCRICLAAALAAIALPLSACGTDEPTDDPSAVVEPSGEPSGSEQPSETPEPTPTAIATDLSEVKVEGDVGKEPVILVTPPWAIKETTVKVLDEGDGPVVGEKATVRVNYHGVNGRTGKMFDSSFKRGAPSVFPLTGVVPGFAKGIGGEKVGSRILIGIPGKDGYDPAGNPKSGINPGDTLLFVVEILDASLDAPSGKEQKLDAALPQVSKGIGKPTVTVPKDFAAGKETTSHVVIAGDGTKVAAGAQIVVNYQMVAASSGKVIAESYGQQPLTGQLNQLIPGWIKGLDGKAAGSRVLLVVPPKDAYPDGNEKPKIDAGETLIFVVDLLMVNPAT